MQLGKKKQPKKQLAWTVLIKEASVSLIRSFPLTVSL